MNFKIAYHSNIGTTKKVNQDSIGYKEISMSNHKYSLTVVCDGMGGLQKGEMAGATVVRKLMSWIEAEFEDLDETFNYAVIQNDLRRVINVCNKALYDYGVNNGIQLGTTLSTVLVRDDGAYLIANVGDSRVYLITQEYVNQLTEDQTYIANEIKNNRMTVEEAKESKYKNVLTQCIGVNETVEVLFYRGKLVEGEAFLLCSDGFRHFLNEDDIYEGLHDVCVSDDVLKWEENLKKITLENMNKGEKDNITSVILKVE